MIREAMVGFARPHTKLDPAGAGLYFSDGLLVVSAAIGKEGGTLQPRDYVERSAGGHAGGPDTAHFVSGRGYYLGWLQTEDATPG